MDIDLLSPDRFASGHPFAQYRWLRENAPVFWHEDPHGPGFWAVTRYDDVVASARTCEELAAGFLKVLGETVRNEGHLHRLWYDLRSQSLFEEAFRADVLEIDKSLEDMIWRIMSRFAELTGEPQQMPPSVLYAVLDGLFQQCLLKHLSGDPAAVAEMQADVRSVLARVAGVPLTADPSRTKNAKRRQPA